MNGCAAGGPWVAKVAYRPRGGGLAAAVDKMLRLWDAAGTVVYESADHASTVSDLAWNPDGKRCCDGILFRRDTALGGPSGPAPEARMERCAPRTGLEPFIALHRGGRIRFDSACVAYQVWPRCANAGLSVEGAGTVLALWRQPFGDRRERHGGPAGLWRHGT